MAKKTDWNWKDCKPNRGASGAVYGLGFIGAVIYYLTTATTILAGLIGIVKAIFWPAFVVYGLLKLLGM
jgi:hypothetical protein